MLNFDQTLFYNTYNNLLEEKTFRQIFYDVFLPLLCDLGMLWQTNAISSSHEHFLTMHIRRKILVQIERLQSLNPKPSQKTFVLFLPKNETHDLGLLFLNFEVLNAGYHSIFLGENIPMDSIQYINDLYDDITYISYFTVNPSDSDVEKYLKKFSKRFLKKSNNSAKFIGHKTKSVALKSIPKRIKLYSVIEDLVKDL